MNSKNQYRKSNQDPRPLKKNWGRNISKALSFAFFFTLKPAVMMAHFPANFSSPPALRVRGDGCSGAAIFLRKFQRFFPALPLKTSSRPWGWAVGNRQYFGQVNGGGFFHHAHALFQFKGIYHKSGGVEVSGNPCSQWIEAALFRGKHWRAIIHYSSSGLNLAFGWHIRQNNGHSKKGAYRSGALHLGLSPQENSNASTTFSPLKNTSHLQEKIFERQQHQEKKEASALEKESNEISAPSSPERVTMPFIPAWLNACLRRSEGAVNQNSDSTMLALGPDDLSFQDLLELVDEPEDFRALEQQQENVRQELLRKLSEKILDEVPKVNSVEHLGGMLIRLGRFCIEPVVIIGEDMANSALNLTIHRSLNAEERRRFDLVAEVVQTVVNGVLSFVPGYTIASRILLPIGTILCKLGAELEEFSGTIEKFEDGVAAIKIAIQALFGHAPILSYVSQDLESLFDHVTRYCHAFPIALREGRPVIELSQHGKTTQHQLFQDENNDRFGFYITELKNDTLMRTSVYFDQCACKWKKIDPENLGAKEELEVIKKYGISKVKHPITQSYSQNNSKDPQLSWHSMLCASASPIAVETLEEKKILVIPLLGSLVPVERCRNSWWITSLTDPMAEKIEVQYEMQHWHLSAYLPRVELAQDILNHFEVRPCNEPKNVSEVYLFPNQYGVYSGKQTQKKYIYIHQRPYEIDKFIEGESTAEGSKFGIVSFSRQAGRVYCLYPEKSSNHVILTEPKTVEASNALWESESKEIVSVYAMDPFLKKGHFLGRDRILQSHLSSGDEHSPTRSNRWKLPLQRSSVRSSSYLKKYALELIDIYGYRVAAKVSDDRYASLIRPQDLESESPCLLSAIKIEGKWRLDFAKLEKDMPQIMNRLKEYSSIHADHSMNRSFASGNSEFIIFVDEEPTAPPKERSGASLAQLMNLIRDNQTTPFKIESSLPLFYTTQAYLMEHLDHFNRCFESSGRLFRWKDSSILLEMIEDKSCADSIKKSHYFLKNYPESIGLERLGENDLNAYNLDASNESKKVYAIKQVKSIQRPLTYWRAFQTLYGEDSSFLAILPSGLTFDGEPKCKFSLFLKKFPGISLSQLCRDVQSGSLNENAALISAKAFLKHVFFKRGLTQLNDMLSNAKLLHNALNSDYLLYNSEEDQLCLTHFDIASFFPEELDHQQPEMIQLFQQQAEEFEAILTEVLEKLSPWLTHPTLVELSIDLYHQLCQKKMQRPTEIDWNALEYDADSGIYHSPDHRKFLWTKFQQIFEIINISNAGEVTFVSPQPLKYFLQKNANGYYLVVKASSPEK